MDTLLRAQQQGVVLGLKGLSDAPVPRLDVDELLLEQPDTFNLFLLALSELQEDKFATEKMAWQQITGIHGLPIAAWDTVRGKGDSGFAGYCAHSRPTFPTWHRPYLAMLEQSLYAKMAEIAERYPDKFKPKYRAAVKTFRLPYWDYYRPRSEGTTTMPGIVGPGGTTTFDYDFSLPQVLVVEEVMVRHYDNNDEMRTFPNPLRTFYFPANGGLTPDDWNLARGFSKQQTVRYPRSLNDTNGSVVDQSAILNRARENGVKYILHMMRNYDSYGTFASDSLTTGASGNLEDIHGRYHGNIGGRGHMGRVAVAAFDPVFWLHHCLIDRWLAIWQSVHPNRWYDGQFRDSRNGNSITRIPPLATEPAMPFRHPRGDFWNGNLSRDTKTFGYVYKDATYDSPEEALANFVRLYEWASRRDPEAENVSPPQDLLPLPVHTAQVFQYAAADRGMNFMALNAAEPAQAVFSAKQAATQAPAENTHSTVPVATAVESSGTVDTTPVAPGESTSSIAFTNLRTTDVENTPSQIKESDYYREWFVDNIVKRLALNGSFTVYYFIGPFEDDVNNYALQPTMAGLSYIFSASREACDNCGMQDDDNIEVTGTEIITPMLMDYVKIGQLPDLTPTNIVPFLIKNLKWRIVDENGNRHNPREVTGFTVGISCSLNPVSGEGPPVYEEYPQVVEQIIGNSS